MTEYSLAYGHSQVNFELPSTSRIDVLNPNVHTPLSDPAAAIQSALDHPLGKNKLCNFPVESTIGIAINDKTRPLPHPNPLNNLITMLIEAGFSKHNIKLFIGSGTHTPMKPVDFSQILDAEIIANHPIVVHDCDHSPLVDLGKTNYGTSVFINEDFYNCDLKICVGNIEPHHFMGFSGGVKTATIGLAGRETITVNHTMLSHPQSQAGLFHLNPMRQDIEEIGEKINVHFCLGSIINEEKQITKIVWGDSCAVMNVAVPYIKNIFGVSVNQKYDLVIASPGGHPKDINLYQAQKGLTHAARITKDGGWVILLAACPEGSGSQRYEDYIRTQRTHQAVINDFKKGYFEVGPHKAFQIAREAVRLNIILVSDLPAQNVKDWKLTPSKPKLMEPLLKWLIEKLPLNPNIAIMPAATRTMTEVHNDK